MRLKFTFWHLLLIVFLLPQVVKSQISAGGFPIQVLKEKSSFLETTDLVVMPKLNNDELRNRYNSDTDELKPFVFAHTFDVALTMKNSGNWFNTTTVNVWQLRVRSVDAYSLNFVFENFRIPTGAKLFLISNTTGEAKGAYTSENNPESGIFAVEPIAGDEILVQYEEPVNPEFQGQFTITKISHDFVGIVSNNIRRNPYYPSGLCNVNINCDVASSTKDNKNAVGKIIIMNEVCTGTLMNNTAKDKAPYLLTAYHCFVEPGKTTSTASEMEYRAQASVYLFNYEAPYCSYYNSPTIDGYINNTLSGSTIVSSFDSLDFALVRLNQQPPYYYRAYLAGWNRANTTPSNTLSIHHPWGDVKKVAIDLDSPLTKTFPGYLTNGFWNIVVWDYGVTEFGSSGGPLLDQNKLLIGTLSGGSADCIIRKNDFFEKFALSWDYRKEKNKQLKAWLDPANLNPKTLDGMYLESGKNLCTATTNFQNSDVQTIVEINGGLSKKGYWSGTNLVRNTELAEQYKFAKNCVVQGIALGIAKLKVSTADTLHYINLKIYEGTSKPEKLLYTERYDIGKFYNDAMNYIPLKMPVQTQGNFFVSLDISNLSPADTLVVYMANRKSDQTNSFFLKTASGWSSYNAQNLSGNGSALLTELVVCNVDDPYLGGALLAQQPGIKIYPNPLSGNALLKITTEDPIDCPEELEVFDLLGRRQDILVSQDDYNTVSLNLSGKMPGIYLVRLFSGNRQLEGKITYLP